MSELDYLTFFRNFMKTTTLTVFYALFWIKFNMLPVQAWNYFFYTDIQFLEHYSLKTNLGLKMGFHITEIILPHVSIYWMYTVVAIQGYVDTWAGSQSLAAAATPVHFAPLPLLDGAGATGGPASRLNTGCGWFTARGGGVIWHGSINLDYYLQELGKNRLIKKALKNSFNSPHF